LAVPDVWVFRVDEMARKRPAPESCWRVAEEGGKRTHLALRLGGLPSSGRVDLMREGYALGTVRRDWLWDGGWRQAHRRKPSDDSEKADMADRTGVLRCGFIDGGSWDRCHAKQAPTVRQVIFAGSVGEPAEMPDLHKPGRKDMLQEAAQKLHSADRHDVDLIIVATPPVEAHLAVLEGDEP